VTAGVLRIPLEARRTQIQEIPWVEEARRAARILPNRLRVGNHREDAGGVLPPTAANSR